MTKFGHRPRGPFYGFASKMESGKEYGPYTHVEAQNIRNDLKRHGLKMKERKANGTGFMVWIKSSKP